MALVLRMKYVSRFLLLAGSLIVWVVALSVLNDAYLNVEEYVLLTGALLAAVAQTWALAFALRT